VAIAVFVLNLGCACQIDALALCCSVAAPTRSFLRLMAKIHLNQVSANYGGEVNAEVAARRCYSRPADESEETHCSLISLTLATPRAPKTRKVTM
jgi:hypothetical protein